ncbi:hypothetical protein C8J56DRAFT_790915 [Mycena floridula]|nr:hypothetical protein C8J56DRAFT_790915 [Mycena floridula]
MEELQRTVTIVFWFKSNAEPIRLPLSIPTFPLFQLSRFSSLTSDLGLSPTSYLDTYNPVSGWEQHTVATVRIVQPMQRLLYRARRSLLEGLHDNECPNLQAELALQVNHAVTEPRKRPAPDSPDNNSQSKQPKLSPFYIPPPMSLQPVQPMSPFVQPISPPIQPMTPPVQSMPIQPMRSSIPPSSPLPVARQAVVPVPQVSEPATTKYLHHPLSYASETSSQPTLQASKSSKVNTSSTPSIPFHPHPPMKRWPNDYTVIQISRGFYAMDNLVSVPFVPTLTDESQSAVMTQKVAFERIFGTRYVKSTVCRHRALWRKASAKTREQFEAYGENDERGIWGDFVKVVEGKGGKPGKKALDVEEPIMDSL